MREMSQKKDFHGKDESEIMVCERDESKISDESEISNESEIRRNGWLWERSEWVES